MLCDFLDELASGNKCSLTTLPDLRVIALWSAMLISLTSVKLAIGLPNLKAKSCSLIPELCKDFTSVVLLDYTACALWSLILTSCTSAWLADGLPDLKAKSGSGCEDLETEGVSLFQSLPYLIDFIWDAVCSCYTSTVVTDFIFSTSVIRLIRLLSSSSKRLFSLLVSAVAYTPWVSFPSYSNFAIRLESFLVSVCISVSLLLIST